MCICVVRTGEQQKYISQGHDGVLNCSYTLTMELAICCASYISNAQVAYRMRSYTSHTSLCAMCLDVLFVIFTSMPPTFEFVQLVLNKLQLHLIQKNMKLSLSCARRLPNPSLTHLCINVCVINVYTTCQTKLGSFFVWAQCANSI